MRCISAESNKNLTKPAPGGTKINFFSAGSNINTIKSEISDIDGKYYIKDNSQILSNIVRKRISLEKTYKSNCYLSNNTNCQENKKKFNNYESSGTKTMMLRLNAIKQEKQIK